MRRLLCVLLLAAGCSPVAMPVALAPATSAPASSEPAAPASTARGETAPTPPAETARTGDVKVADARGPEGKDNAVKETPAQAAPATRGPSLGDVVKYLRGRGYDCDMLSFQPKTAAPDGTLEILAIDDASTSSWLYKFDTEDHAADFVKLEKLHGCPLVRNGRIVLQAGVTDPERLIAVFKKFGAESP
jgi:hypothetical protein